MSRRREAIRRGLGERPGDRGRHRLRHPTPNCSHGGRLGRDVLTHNAFRRRPCERRLAREHLVEHTAEAVDITASVEIRLRGRLLGTHIRWGAYGHAGLGEVLIASGLKGPRDAEVGHERVPATE